MNKDQAFTKQQQVSPTSWQKRWAMLWGCISMLLASACGVSAKAYIIEPRTRATNSRQKDTGSSRQRVVIVGDRIELKQRIHFGFNSDKILEDSFSLLNEIVDLLKEHTEISMIRIEGHTDQTGSSSHNKSLSERRAAAVKHYLEQQRVPQSLVSAGFGDQMPLCSKPSEACHAKNRRVELIIQKRK